MITLRYAITKEDYVNYYTYLMWDAPENRQKKIKYYARQVIPIIIFILAFYYTGIFERNSNFILLILGSIFLISLLSLINVRSNTVKRAEKIANDPGNSSVFLEHSLIASESGISTKNEMMESTFQWKSFIKKQENKDYYFLFISSMQALIIPKRIFDHSEDRTRFEKLLSQYLSFDAEIGYLVKS